MKRIRVELLILLLIGIILGVLGSIMPAGWMSLFLFKAMLISAGTVHAHIVRKLLFPYIDFKWESDFGKKLLIIVLYGVIIFTWGTAG
jgi:hypothetical protein